MHNILVSIFATLLFIIALLSMLTPIPGATLLFAISLSMLICSNSKVLASVRFIRTKSQKLNKLVLWLEKKIGARISYVGTSLAKTRPLSTSS